MLKKILLALMFAITATTNVTHAEDDMKTVASKAYVDTKIETKQLKIPAAGQPNVGAGETVMTYTATGNGQIGERGLYSDISSYNATTDGDKLITASALNATFTNLPTTPTTKLECANESEGCTLWTIVDQTAYGNELPSGYTRLQYIESTRTQYIDTGYKLKSNNVVYEWAGIDKSTTSGTSLFGAQGTGSSLTYSGIPYGNRNYRKFFTGRTQAADLGYVSNDTSLHTWRLILNNSTQTLVKDSSIVGTSSFTGGLQKEHNIFVFANDSSGSATQLSDVAMEYFRIIDDGEIVFNGLPARRNSDNVVGMYDTVSGQFFTNRGTGDFVAGPLVQ